MNTALKIQAGPKAIAEIETNGFSQDLVKMMFGASGGPKWLILAEMDKYLCGTFFKDRTEPLHLLGSSIGAWRFANYAQKNPVYAIEQFHKSYLNIMGSTEDEKKMLKSSRMHRDLKTGEFLDALFKDGLEEMILNPVYKLGIVGSHCRGMLKSDARLPLMMGLSSAALNNGIHRKFLARSVHRAIFFTDVWSPFLRMNDFPTEDIRLNVDNIRGALFATGSIPFSNRGVCGLHPHKKKQLYRDGGIVDYHFNVSTSLSEGIILYPHFFDRTVPGWFDQYLPFRKSKASNFERVLMISPSDELMNKISRKKLSDRKDFKKLDVDECRKFWQEVSDIGKYMVDEFHELIIKEEMASACKPFKF